MRWNEVIAFAVALVIASAVLGVVAWSRATTEAQSAFSDETGSSPLIEEARAQGAQALRLLSGPLLLATSPSIIPSDTLLVVVAPSNPYDGDEARAVQDFLNAGGHLLVADDYGQSNSLLGPLGVAVERVRLVEPGWQGNVTTSWDARTAEVLLSSPSALRVDPQSASRVLAASGTQSFLDRDGNGVIGNGEPLGPFPLIVDVMVGSAGGSVLVVCDPDVLRFSEDPMANREFVRLLVDRLLPAQGLLLIDESRQPTTDPLLAGVLTVVGVTGAAQWRIALVSVAVVAVLVALTAAIPDAWRRHKANPDHFIRRSQLASDEFSRDDEPAASMLAERPTTRWTRRGRAAVWGGILLAVGGLATNSHQATYAAAFLLTAAALTVFAGPLRVTAMRVVSVYETQEDAPVSVELSLSARTRTLRLVEVRDALPPSFHVSRGETWFGTWLSRSHNLGCSYEIKPALRGPHRLGPLRVRSQDPFHLRVSETVAVEGHELIVHPRLETLGRIPFKSKLPLVTLGPHLVSRSGEGAEFHSLRDYAVGDSIRSVNWKASARSPTLMVNQRVHESMATITILIDARAVSGAGPARRSPINEACRAALSVAAAAIRVRDKVAVYAYGGGVQELVSGAGGNTIPTLSAALADLHPTGACSLVDAVDAILLKLRPRSPCIVISGFESDASVATAIKRLRDRGAIPVAIALPIGTAPIDHDEGPPEADAGTLQAERENVISNIHAAGIPLFQPAAGQPLAVALRLGGM